MLTWELSSLRLMLPVLIAVQLLMGVGLAVGMGLVVTDLSPEGALYLVSGASGMTLIVAGLAVGPQIVSEHRRQGTYDFLWSLPVPRSAATAAWYGVTLILGVPAFAATLLVGSWRYDLDMHVSWRVIPAVLLVVFASTLLGYAMAHTVPSPVVVMALSGVLIFGVMGFTPINFPADRLPGWLQTVHEWLPLSSMGTIVRASVMDGAADGLTRAYLLVTGWTVAATAIVAVALRRRG